MDINICERKNFLCTILVTYFNHFLKVKCFVTVEIKCLGQMSTIFYALNRFLLKPIIKI